MNGIENGDLVVVEWVGDDDIRAGIKVGDIFKVIGYGTIPCCKPIKSSCKWAEYALLTRQLKLVE